MDPPKTLIINHFYKNFDVFTLHIVFYKKLRPQIKWLNNQVDETFNIWWYVVIADNWEMYYRATVVTDPTFRQHSSWWLFTLLHDTMTTSPQVEALNYRME